MLAISLPECFSCFVALSNRLTANSDGVTGNTGVTCMVNGRNGGLKFVSRMFLFVWMVGMVGVVS